MTAPDHIYRAVRRNACINGGVHRCTTRSDRAVRSRRRKIAPLMVPCWLWRGAGDVQRGALCGGLTGGCRRGVEPSRGGPAVRHRPPDGEEDAELFGAPGYRRTKPVRRPKLDGFTGIVDAILEADTDRDVLRKQRHTAHRIFERLREAQPGINPQRSMERPSTSASARTTPASWLGAML